MFSQEKELLRGATTENSVRDRSPIKNTSEPFPIELLEMIKASQSSSADTNKQESAVLDMRMEAPAKQAAATSASRSDHSIHQINGNCITPGTPALVIPEFE